MMSPEQLQELLDEQARLSNAHYEIKKLIKANRGNCPPPCWGDDDCSANILSKCPWRIDCYIGDRHE
jgi:hypothetical protein